MLPPTTVTEANRDGLFGRIPRRVVAGAGAGPCVSCAVSRVLGAGAGAGAELARQGGALSPVVTLEPRRRKFHRPVTVTMPLPGPATNTASIETSLLVTMLATRQVR